MAKSEKLDKNLPERRQTPKARKDEIKKLKAELKVDSKAQTELLRKIAAGECEVKEQKILQQSAYVIELRQNLAPARYPEASWLSRGADKTRPLWMPYEKMLKKFDVASDGLLYGIAFDEVMCLYKPKTDSHDNDSMSMVLPVRREDPVRESWPSLLNTRKISELCSEAVDAAAVAARAQMEIEPELKAVYQVGRILYLDYEHRTDIEGNAETDVLLYCCDDGRAERFLRKGDDLYLAKAGEPCESSGRLVMKYDYLKGVNEPYRLAQWFVQFKRFEVKSEREWLAMLMQTKKKK